MDENETETPVVETPVVETPVVETPVVETPVVETPVVETPVEIVVPEGYVKAEEVETERTARTAAEEARTAAETARAEADARATAAEARARATEIRAQAQALGFNDPTDAEKFIGADVELDKIGETLTEVLKTKSYLAKQEAAPPVVTPTSPTNPARTATITLETIKSMTQKEVAALPWATVKAALAA